MPLVFLFEWVKILRVKKSNNALTLSLVGGCGKSFAKKGVFKDRFIPSLCVDTIFEKAKNSKIGQKKRVLFHTEVQKKVLEQERMYILKKIL
mgnify:CR=1 FL=1